MTIQTEISELNSIKDEISRNLKKNKVLRKRKAELEMSISSYIESKDTHGLKYKNQAMTIEHSVSRNRKTEKQKKEDLLSYLNSINVKDPQHVYEKIDNLRRGDEKEVTKLRVKKLN